MKTVFGPEDRNDLNNEKYLSFMEIKLFVFSVDTFQLNFYEMRPTMINATITEV